MTKKEFINIIYKKLGNKVSKKSLEDFVDAFISTIKEGVAKGEKISFKDFGVFSVYETKERVCINPVTKEKITVPASKKLKFKQSLSVKEILNN